MNLEKIFAGMDGARIGVLGDFCLDVYWRADMQKSVLSREVPHHPLPIVEERMSPGGAGNVACNVAALSPQAVFALGVIGHDWRGEVLKKCLMEQGVDVQYLLCDDSRVTNAYIKPLRCGISDVIYEDPRLDFENDVLPGPETENRLLRALEEIQVDVLCVCDQMRWGCITPAIRDAISHLEKRGVTVIVDSRDRIGEYTGVIVKPNEVESARCLGEEKEYPEMARLLSERTGKPALITLGDQGCLVCEEGIVTAVPAIPTQPPIDICGAGDTFLSALACALAAGSTLKDAAAVANTASAVTIRKLRTTGTASRDEIRNLWMKHREG